jgi:hypothetical protein
VIQTAVSRLVGCAGRDGRVFLFGRPQLVTFGAVDARHRPPGGSDRKRGGHAMNVPT